MSGGHLPRTSHISLLTRVHSASPQVESSTRNLAGILSKSLSFRESIEGRRGGRFCIWFDHSRHWGKLNLRRGGRLSVRSSVLRSTATTTMIGGDDNITQNVDWNERRRERGTKMREEAECKRYSTYHLMRKCFKALLWVAIWVRVSFLCLDF